MRKLVISITAIMLAMPAMAQEDQATVDPVIAAIAPICEIVDQLNVSPKVIAACNGDESMLPSYISDGTRFANNRSTGAEFNVLVANYDILFAGVNQ